MNVGSNLSVEYVTTGISIFVGSEIDWLGLECAIDAILIRVLVGRL